MIGFGPWLILMTCFAVPLITVQLILRELYRRHSPSVPHGWCLILKVISWTLVLSMAVTTAGMLGASFGYALVVLAIALLIQSIVIRRLEERELLEWLTVSVVSGGSSIPDAFEQFAGKRTNLVSRRCRDFAYELRTGMRPSMAAKKSRMPLSVGALLTLDDGKTAPMPSVPSNTTLAAPIGATVALPIAGQLAYFASFFFMFLIMTFICLFIIPTFAVMFDEFGIRGNIAMNFLANSGREMNAVFLLFFFGTSILCVLIFTCLLLPSRWLLRATPWFGGWIRNRGQYHGLRALAAGLRSGRTMIESTKATELLTRSRWIKSRARSTRQRLESGQSIATSLCSGGFVGSAEARWIAAADSTGHLANSLESIAENSWRRFELLWRIRLSWLIPITVLVFGFCVLFIFYAVMSVLTDLIIGLT